MEILKLRDIPDALSGLSIGFDKCRRVVVPGNMYGKDEPSMAYLLKRSRAAGKMWAQAVISANLAGWGEPFPKPSNWPSANPVTSTV